MKIILLLAVLGLPLSALGTTYYSPMHPWIQQDTPGMCPICMMELVPMPAEEDK